MNAPNKLIDEKSPYLLQHAYNPVNWYPWSNEAFHKAKEENKPVFLSVGYSTCRWCHNMKRESFEDEEVASLLNENYVAVKVDREELPHVDKVYMSVCEALTGRGGWPLTVIMTPDEIPFFAGTYFPKENTREMIGLKELLNIIVEKWKVNKKELIEKGNEIAEVVSSHLKEVKEGSLDKELIDEGYMGLKERFDEKFGGFGNSPKFPMPASLLFLLRYQAGSYEEEYIKDNEKERDSINCSIMLDKTLHGMYRGGLFDHLGGGFYRYTIDNKWLVPHFEKMLYDNIMLSMVYLEAYQWNKNKLYKEITQLTLDFLQREMLSEKKAFYTAIDAESEGEEGKFYLWDHEEINDILGSSRGNKFSDYYGVTKAGNFEGRNILNRLNKKDQSEIEIRKEFNKDISKVFQARKKRIPPMTDDKILTSLNSLAVVCFSKAGRVLKNKKYTDIAENALKFILKYLRKSEDGRVMARYREGEAAFLGNLEDYAYLAWALIEFYQVSFQDKYLKMAENIVSEAEGLFKDDDINAFYKYGKDAKELFARPVEVFDGSTPSGNSVMLYVILKLAILIDNKQKDYERKAFDLIKALAGTVEDNPAFSSFFLIGAMIFLNPPLKVNIYDNDAGKENKVQQFVDKIDSIYLPDVLINVSRGKTAGADDAKEGEAFAEVCDSLSCRGKVLDPDDLEKLLFTR